MSAQVELPKGHPMRDAWETYRATDEYKNTRRWALTQAHVDGSLWAAFIAGYGAALPAVPSVPEAAKATVIRARRRNRFSGEWGKWLEVSAETAISLSDPMLTDQSEWEVQYLGLVATPKDQPAQGVDGE